MASISSVVLRKLASLETLVFLLISYVNIATKLNLQLVIYGNFLRPFQTIILAYS